LLALPTVVREFEERYSFTPSDLEFVGAHRTNSNRLGIAVQLCFLCHPGWAWTPEKRIPATMLRWIAAQVRADPVIAKAMPSATRPGASIFLNCCRSTVGGVSVCTLMLRKLGAYPRQNALALALREIGKLERTLFLLEFIQNIELRKRIHAGLNKGEARNALARAVFFNRLGELRDRTYENQQHRASGLNLGCRRDRTLEHHVS
jgi:TnpA family transposase